MYAGCLLCSYVVVFLLAGIPARQTANFYIVCFLSYSPCGGNTLHVELIRMKCSTESMGPVNNSPGTAT